MKKKTAMTILLFVAAMSLTAWISYWLGFSKSLEISSYIDRRRDLSLSMEYKHWVAKLDSGNIQEVRSDLQSIGDILNEQAAIKGGEGNRLLDILVPTGGFSLLRDYDADRERRNASQESSKPW